MSLVVMDILVELSSGALCDVEIQKAPYGFPGQRAACCFAFGNMIKAVRCVTIPNFGGMVVIETAVILGVEDGDADKGMEVFSKGKRVKELLNADFCRMEL